MQTSHLAEFKIRLRLSAILVTISAASLIMARFNAANEQIPKNLGQVNKNSVSFRDLQPDQWYAAKFTNRVAEIQTRELKSNQVLEIVVSTVRSDIEESQIVVELKSGKERSSPLRFEPIPKIECRSGLKLATNRHQSESDTPVVVTEEAASTLRRTFTIPLMTPDGNLGKSTTLCTRPVVKTSNVEVLADDSIKVNQSMLDLASEIAESMEQRVMPVLNQKVGTALDVDGSGRLSIVLSPKVPGFTKGKNRVKGFVLPGDMISQCEPSEPSEGNRADVIFLDSSLPRGEALVSLLAHEFTHISSLSNARRHELGTPAMWVNEAVAHVGEQFCSDDDSNIRDRLSAFLHEAYSTPLLLDQGGVDELHRDRAVRGASFSFVDWCVRSTNDDLIRELTLRPGETKAVLENESGLSFGELIQQWGLSLAESHSPAFLDISEKKFSERKMPMTVKVTGTGNLFLRCSDANGKRIKFTLPVDARANVAFRIRTVFPNIERSLTASALRSELFRGDRLSP